MYNNDYSILKQHFDKLIYGGGYPINNGLEPIRDSYERAFNRKINLFDVYETKFRLHTNPLSGIVTLVGPEQDDVPSGIIGCYNNVFSVNILPDSIFRGINPENGFEYINTVYNAMENVVQMDTFHVSDTMAWRNPYLVFIKCCPFYFTYHHIRDSQPQLMDDYIFKKFLERYIVANDEDIDVVYDSVKNSKFSADSDIIYKTMTVGNKVELLYYRKT